MAGDDRYDRYEDALWERLAALLPSPGDAADFLECRVIGEQEAGLWMLTRRLLEQRVPVGDRARVEIEVLAEYWGERHARHDDIAALIPDAGPLPSVRTVADAWAEPITVTEAGISDPGLSDKVVVPWLECLRCDSVLERVHTPEPWGGFVSRAEHYVLHPRDDFSSGGLRIFGPSELLQAMETLLTCG
ncbi:hypothetical protein ACWIGI_37005 [Nocardia sp. NPDC055321]